MSAKSGKTPKIKARATLLAARRSLPAPVRREADAALCASLVALVREREPRSIAGYVPTAGEPGGDRLPAALAETVGQGRLLLPVLCPDLDLDWAAYAGPDDLCPSARGVREPSGRRLGRAAVGTVELVVAPAVAVDRYGLRLGRGGGSYDRALARLGPHTLVVVPLYEGELVDELPAEAHDRRVHAVVTPGAGLQMLQPGH